MPLYLLAKKGYEAGYCSWLLLDFLNLIEWENQNANR
jgi:hypothetical protein